MAYSSEDNGIEDRANQEVLRHFRALLFDSIGREQSIFIIEDQNAHPLIFDPNHVDPIEIAQQNE